jgi:hypothetical protein
LREIQELLRHKNIRTTVRYTHVGYEQTVVCVSRKWRNIRKPKPRRQKNADRGVRGVHRLIPSNKPAYVVSVIEKASGTPAWSQQKSGCQRRGAMQ